MKQVFDGDTVLLTNNQKIRLLGIDAFEHDQLPYGPKAKEFLIMLTLNKKVCVETDIEEKDIYGRTLGYVFINGRMDVRAYGRMEENSLNHTPTRPHAHTPIFINEELLKSGNAILYDFPPNIKYIDRLKKAQIFARQNMIGIWEKHSYIPETPAQWRHKHPYKKR